MNRKYLGDSYDAVKRLWQEVFSGWAPLFAEPRYIPEDIRDAYKTLTCIPLLCDIQRESYSIFNDPDTGIRLPDRINQSEGSTHINLDTIPSQLEKPGVRCVLTFDQSRYREPGLSSSNQRYAKANRLRQKGFIAFYYVSHASFLFAFKENDTMKIVRDYLLKFGIPNDRIEEYE